MSARVEGLTDQNWEFVPNVHRKRSLFTRREFTPRVAERGLSEGETSILRKIGSSGWVHDCSPNAGLQEMIRGVVSEWTSKWVTVNAISPGSFAIKMSWAVTQTSEENSALVVKTPMGRWCEIHRSLATAQ